MASGPNAPVVNLSGSLPGISQGLAANRPASGAATNVWYLATDAQVLYRWDGAAWQVELSNGGGGGSGTVTIVATGAGLTGGPITVSGTISIDYTYGGTWTALQTFSAGASIGKLTNLSTNGYVKTGGGIGTLSVETSIDLAVDVTGNLAVTNLASGTGASGSTFWRGDGTWATPAATAYTFGDGLTNTAGTITNNLITGLSGGQTIIGGTADTDQLTFKSTLGNQTGGAAYTWLAGNNGATIMMTLTYSGSDPKLNVGGYINGTAFLKNGSPANTGLYMPGTAGPDYYLTYNNNVVLDVTTTGRTLVGFNPVDDTVNALQVTGNIALQKTGGKLIIPSGTNCSCGVAQLGAGGTVTINSNAVTTNSQIFAFPSTFSGAGSIAGVLNVTNITNLTGFQISSSIPTDNGYFFWFFIN